MTILSVHEYRTRAPEPDDPPTDATIQAALDRYTALIEGYTGRVFNYAIRCEMHYDVGAGPIQLGIYPVAELDSVTVDGETTDGSDYTLHKAAGLLDHDGTLFGDDVLIQYKGGYSSAPEEIKVALTTLVQGYLSGAAGGVNELQVVRKETVMGVSSIDYGTPGDFSKYGDVYAELGPYTSVLEKYHEPGML